MSELHTLRCLVDALFVRSDKPATLALQREGTEHWSYAEVANYVRRLARGLAEVGVGRGEYVALLASNRPEWIVACLAAMEAGAVVVPLDEQFSDEALDRVLSDSGAGLVFTTTEGTGRLECLTNGGTPRSVLLDVGEHDERGWRRLLSDRSTELPQLQPDDLAALFYTSGNYKGVPLSHRNLASQLNALLAADLVTENDRVLLPLPLHHVYPFVVGMLAPLAMGLTIVLPYELTAQQIIRALNEGEVTLAVGTPWLYGALHSAMQQQAESGGKVASAMFWAGASLSTWLRRRLGLRVGKLLLRPQHEEFGPKLRVLTSGGSALNVDLAWRLEGLGWRVATGYGLTETSSLLTFNPPNGKKFGSVGRPIPGVKICLDPSAVPGKEVPWRQKVEHRTEEPYKEGEILGRGPGVFSGYHNMPETLEEAFTGDGWFRTGDLGYFGDEGHLYITGRVSTLIVIAGGENVQVEDIEEAYLDSPGIREIGVLQNDNRLVAVIVPGEIRRRDGDVALAIRDAVGEVSKTLPPHQRISDYVITREPLEYTQLGKLRRHLVASRYDRAKKGQKCSDEAGAGSMLLEEMSEADRDLLGNPAAKGVWDWLTNRYPGQRLTTEADLQLDLDVDSLGWVDLTLEVGRIVGVKLNEEAIGHAVTVRDLLIEVAEQAKACEAAYQASPLGQPEEVLSDQQKRWLEPLGPIESAMARTLFVVGWLVMRGLFRLRVEGVEHLPEQGPFVLTANHPSYLDPFAVGVALGYHRMRQAYWGAWIGVAFSNPLNRLFSRLAQLLPVTTARASVSSLAFGAAVLKRKKNLIWFPEGYRSYTGELQPFKPGIGVLLNHFRVPVVPVFVNGTYEAMPRGSRLPRPKKITVVFGRPLDPRNLEQQGEGEAPQDRIVRALHDRMAELGGRSCTERPKE